jgi:hypothetical protein
MTRLPVTLVATAVNSDSGFGVMQQLQALGVLMIFAETEILYICFLRGLLSTVLPKHLGFKSNVLLWPHFKYFIGNKQKNFSHKHFIIELMQILWR